MKDFAAIMWLLIAITAGSFIANNPDAVGNWAGAAVLAYADHIREAM
jgi:hypothetical protein